MIKRSYCPKKSCRPKVEVVSKVKPSKYEHNDPDEKMYWKGLINQVEKLAKEQNAKKKIKIVDYSRTLPPKLYKRVNKIIKMEPYEKDVFELNDDVNFELLLERREAADEDGITIMEPDPILESTKSDLEMNESEITEVFEKELQFVDLDIFIEPRPKPRKPPPKHLSWFGNYILQPRKERVIWPSKLYHFEKRFLEKSLFEQAEELMDLAAEDFAEWMNSLSHDEATNVNKELVKQLFAIGIEGEATKALYVEPQQISVIPSQLAEDWNLRERGLEPNVEKVTKEDIKYARRPLKMVAFGTTLPLELQHPKSNPWEGVVKPIFPEDIRSCRAVFKAIGHLRSTKALVSHLITHPEIPKPKYLVRKGAFDQKHEEQANDHVPLYEYFFKQT